MRQWRANLPGTTVSVARASDQTPCKPKCRNLGRLSCLWIYNTKGNRGLMCGSAGERVHKTKDFSKENLKTDENIKFSHLSKLNPKNCLDPESVLFSKHY